MTEFLILWFMKLANKRWTTLVLLPCCLNTGRNFIIGASGSDKQMLCGSSVAHAAPTISAVNKIKK